MRRAGVPLLAAAAALLLLGLSAMAGAAGAGVPSGFQPSDFTATSASDWWLLGSVPCGRSQCLRLVRTRNGGHSFGVVPAPPSGTRQRVTVGRISFASARDGYAFGPEVWSTHDGGRHWRRLRVGYADQLVVGGGYAYALVSDGGPPRLMRSPIAHDRWRALPVRMARSPTELFAKGRTVILQSGAGALISADAGRHFTAAGRLPAGMRCSFDATAGGVLWALCFRAAADPGGELLRRPSGNAAWRPVKLSGAPDGLLQAVAVASPQTAVAVVNGRAYRTTDGGTRWSPVRSLPALAPVVFLGFSGAGDGIAIGVTAGHDRVYRTTDAGAGYQPVSLH